MGVSLALLTQPASATFRGSNGKIAYSSGGSIYGVKPDGTGRTRIAANATRPAFSPLGRRIAFERTINGNRDIAVMQADGSGVRRLTYRPAAEGDPAFAPDGAGVALTRKVSGNWDIYRMKADGTGLTRVTRSAYRDYGPAWSSKQTIAFVRNVGGNHDIFTARPGAGRRRVTSRATHDSSPAWSPDSRKIAFVRSGDIYTINLATRALRRLTRSGGFDPSWSPDGTKIAFSRGPTRGREIYVMRADGRGVPRRVTAERGDALSPDWQSSGHDPVIAGAGDIACDPAGRYFNGGAGTKTLCRGQHTANRLLNMDLDKIFALGDDQYTKGTLSQFQQSYDSSWGALRTITAPSVGNHEYRTPSAAGYFDYFNGVDSAAGPAGNRDEGYYSYDVGANWHVVVLNSACGYSGDGGTVPGGCDAGSPQEQWLRADLSANARPCTLAYFHHARFSSAENVRAFWDALYDSGVDLVLNGHDHTYERSAPQTPSGELDRDRGIRQIIVGTGGKSHGALNSDVPNREVANNDTYGILKLTLRPASYRWEFLPEVGKTFADGGTTNCH